MHVACLSVFFVHVGMADWVLAGVLYFARMFGITAGYHRYFAHRSYKTSRLFQFVIAWLGCSSLQKGPLWWAAHHRHHHRHSDEPPDLHSPVIDTFWHSHVGWLFDPKNDATDYGAIHDFARYPELVWMNRLHWVPGLLLGAACFGFSALVSGNGLGGLMAFIVSTVVLYHCTFMINSLAHVFGSRRYETTDDSRNNFALALLTMGEGWHNNHHHYQSAARQGFFWWEVDASYYLLKALSWVGLVWDLREPPRQMLAEPFNRPGGKASRKEIAPSPAD
ncbi:MAG TPA: acyl-CoA desaturase [Gemmataceae bacterium]|jgi:stearoyl-CoA desaturase (delta-9 desaturase)|nr:acyl-CoA desaturase [Gemmataceae bacterium]